MKNVRIAIEKTVDAESDKVTARMQANAVSGVFGMTNNLLPLVFAA